MEQRRTTRSSQRTIILSGEIEKAMVQMEAGTLETANKFASTLFLGHLVVIDRPKKRVLGPLFTGYRGSRDVVEQ